ncbi:MAG: cytochrome c [Thermodesulfobacteriota bacterium]
MTSTQRTKDGRRRRADPAPGTTLLLAAILLGLPGAARAEPRSVMEEAGRSLYVEHCAACHGPHGRGDGTVAAVMLTKPSDLTSLAKRRGGFRAGDVAAYIDGRTTIPAHGTRDMPVWGERLGEDMPVDTADEVARGQITLLVEYLKTIQR